LNTNEHARQHAEAQKRMTESWHRLAADPTLTAQANARAAEAKAKSDALQRATADHRVMPLSGGAA